MLLRAREAAQFLRPRQRRAYQVFEEAKQGHLERECVEEVCSKEEAREVFENDLETDYFYPRYQECMRKYGRPEDKNPHFATCVQNLPDQCTPYPCDKKGTQACQDLMGNFFCACKEGWEGRLCDKGEPTPHPLSAPPTPHPLPETGSSAIPTICSVSASLL